MKSKTKEKFFVEEIGSYIFDKCLPSARELQEFEDNLKLWLGRHVELRTKIFRGVPKSLTFLVKIPAEYGNSPFIVEQAKYFVIGYLVGSHFDFDTIA